MTWWPKLLIPKSNTTGILLSSGGPLKLVGPRALHNLYSRHWCKCCLNSTFRQTVLSQVITHQIHTPQIISTPSQSGRMQIALQFPLLSSEMAPCFGYVACGIPGKIISGPNN